MDHAKIQRSAFEREARDQCENPASISATAKKETETPLTTERVYSSAFMTLQVGNIIMGVFFSFYLKCPIYIYIIFNCVGSTISSA